MQKHTPKLRVALMVVAIAAWVSILVPPAVAENAFVEITGQTTSYADGDDGDIQAGVQFPAMRFRDNGNGTVTDRLTNLIWLKNANCFPISELGITWQQALEAANTLHDTGTPSTTDDCGLSDGSVAGDWRLPNVKELQSLIDFGHISPALPTGHPFLNVASPFYWSSTTLVASQLYAWLVRPVTGDTVGDFKDRPYLVWPVRGGK